jgi:hypothetical protein
MTLRMTMVSLSIVDSTTISARVVGDRHFGSFQDLNAQGSPPDRPISATGPEDVLMR